MTTLLLVRHATTASTRSAAFPATSGAAAVDGCEDLDAGGRRAAEALRPALPRPAGAWSSLARRCVATAEALALRAQPDADLAECDFGAWAGLTPAQVHERDPDGLDAWYADPDRAPHGGERLADVRKRAAAVLERAAVTDGPLAAVTHGGLVKAALLEVLELPSAMVWRLDVAPASVTELHWTHGAWRVVRTNWRPA